MRTIAERWARFEKALLDPIGAGPTQRQEMRRAFYAGFSEALIAGLEMAEESGPDDDRGARMIQALHDECEAFGAEMLKGNA